MSVIEKDPHGKSLHEPGAKADSGKPLPALVLGEFSRALEQIVLVGTYGARKYTPRGWVSVPEGIERYREAAWRHLLADARGESNDPETGLPHLSHAAWNLLAIQELKQRGEC